MRFAVHSMAQRRISLKAKLGYCPVKSEAIRHLQKPHSIQFKEGAKSASTLGRNTPCAHC